MQILKCLVAAVYGNNVSISFISVGRSDVRLVISR